MSEKMTAPWKECPRCSKSRVPGVRFFLNEDGTTRAETCPCAAALRAAFEEALAAEPKKRPFDWMRTTRSYNDGIRAKNAAIRAKMEGEK